MNESAAKLKLKDEDTKELKRLKNEKAQISNIIFSGDPLSGEWVFSSDLHV